MKRRQMEKMLREVNVLEIKPIRAAGAEERDGRMVVHRPKPTSRGLRRLLDGFLHAMSASRIRLDDLGSFSWERMDGTRTVQEIAEELRAEFGDEADQAEERLARLVRWLRQEELVRYVGWDG
jgi:hypothetical protein